MTILNVHILTWIGIGFIAIGTICTILGQQIINDKSTSELTNKTEKIEKLSEKNVGLSAEVAELSKKNSAMSEKLTKYVTGGDSFCYLIPMPDQISDRQSFMLIHEGGYPLYDVNIHVENRSLTQKLPMKELYDEITESHKRDIEQGKSKQRDLSYEMQALLNSTKKSFQIGTLPPKTAITIDRFPLAGFDELEFFVRIHTRNAYFTQTIVEKRFDKDWKLSWQVLKHKADGKLKVVKELITKEVPIKE